MDITQYTQDRTYGEISEPELLSQRQRNRNQVESVQVPVPQSAERPTPSTACISPEKLDTKPTTKNRLTEGGFPTGKIQEEDELTENLFRIRPSSITNGTDDQAGVKDN